MPAMDRRRFLQSSTLAATSAALARYAPAQGGATAVDARIDLSPAETLGTIAPEIYSHFIEQLGRGGV